METFHSRPWRGLLCPLLHWNNLPERIIRSPWFLVHICKRQLYVCITLRFKLTGILAKSTTPFVWYHTIINWHAVLSKLWKVCESPWGITGYSNSFLFAEDDTMHNGLWGERDHFFALCKLHLLLLAEENHRTKTTSVRDHSMTLTSF